MLRYAAWYTQSVCVTTVGQQYVDEQRGGSMAKRLAKRTAPKAVEAPKPAPARGKEEPDTFICEVAKTVVSAKDTEPMLGKCKGCFIMPSHSEVDHLCYNCHKDAEGLEFDADKKRWVKRRK